MGEFNIYNEILDFSDFIHLFMDKGKRIDLKKNEYFCMAGEHFPFIAYLEKGAFRYTCDDANGKEHILSYAFENEVFGNYSPLQNNSYTIANIQAVQNSVIYTLPISEINSFFNSSMDAQLLGRRIAEVILFSMAQRLKSVYCNTPEERYLSLIRKCPDVLNRITLREMASYLMITPETLSRIRRRIVLKRKS
ncbi:MAG: Crp/Fnr family transcriptional regulator [Bacteroides oleiciplenus]|nr:Crp/Fnr family transcriptional regulator [Bacteroides oleiciplenus]